jgi:hypothetical protein
MVYAWFAPWFSDSGRRLQRGAELAEIVNPVAEIGGQAALIDPLAGLERVELHVDSAHLQSRLRHRQYLVM